MLGLIRELFEPAIRHAHLTADEFFSNPIIKALLDVRRSSHGRIDVDYLRSQYRELGNSISAESNAKLLVNLGHDPFGIGAKMREERRERRANYEEHEARNGGRTTGSAFAPHAMGFGLPVAEARSAPVSEPPRKVKRPKKSAARNTSTP